MRKLLYALAAVAALAPLAAFGTASAAPARPAVAARAAAPLNLDQNKCFKFTDADGGGYGSLYINSKNVAVSSHTYWTLFCPTTLGNGWQILGSGLGLMAYHAIDNYVTSYYISSAFGSPNCALASDDSSAAKYCEWDPSVNSSGNWTLRSAYSPTEYITSVSSGSQVELATYNGVRGGDQHWIATCEQQQPSAPC